MQHKVRLFLVCPSAHRIAMSLILRQSRKQDLYRQVIFHFFDRVAMFPCLCHGVTAFLSAPYFKMFPHTHAINFHFCAKLEVWLCSRVPGVHWIRAPPPRLSLLSVLPVTAALLPPFLPCPSSCHPLLLLSSFLSPPSPHCRRSLYSPGAACVVGETKGCFLFILH